MSVNGTIHISMMKNWVCHILFLRKRGLIVYLAALKKGAFRHAHPYYVIYHTIVIRKFSSVFAINNSEKIRDHQLSSKNPIVTKKLMFKFTRFYCSIPYSNALTFVT